jgi:hypothetical protein
MRDAAHPVLDLVDTLDQLSHKELASRLRRPKAPIVVLWTRADLPVVTGLGADPQEELTPPQRCRESVRCSLA